MYEYVYTVSNFTGPWPGSRLREYTIPKSRQLGAGFVEVSLVIHGVNPANAPSIHYEILGSHTSDDSVNINFLGVLVPASTFI